MGDNFKELIDFAKSKGEITFSEINDFLPDDFTSSKKLDEVINQLMEMVPGLSSLTRKMPQGVDETRMKRVEAIIRSMTPQERSYPNIIDGSRRKRIARGSGTTPQDINRLLNQFNQTRKLLKQLDSGKTRHLLSMLK